MDQSSAVRAGVVGSAPLVFLSPQRSGCRCGNAVATDTKDTLATGEPVPQFEHAAGVVPRREGPHDDALAQQEAAPIQCDWGVCDLRWCRARDLMP